MKNTNSDLLDEIGYRSIAIGFPVFTLGALIFAMIWAQIAWTRFGDGIRKRFGRLLLGSFMLRYYIYVYQKDGTEKSAWLAVIGFAIIMFNFIVVNLIIAGLHSYA